MNRRSFLGLLAKGAVLLGVGSKVTAASRAHDADKLSVEDIARMQSLAKKHGMRPLKWVSREELNEMYLPHQELNRPVKVTANESIIVNTPDGKKNTLFSGDSIMWDGVNVKINRCDLADGGFDVKVM